MEIILFAVSYKQYSRVSRCIYPKAQLCLLPALFICLFHQYFSFQVILCTGCQTVHRSYETLAKTLKFSIKPYGVEQLSGFYFSVTSYCHRNRRKKMKVTKTTKTRDSPNTIQIYKSFDLGPLRTAPSLYQLYFGLTVLYIPLNFLQTFFPLCVFYPVTNNSSVFPDIIFKGLQGKTKTYFLNVI